MPTPRMTLVVTDGGVISASTPQLALAVAEVLESNPAAYFTPTDILDRAFHSGDLAHDDLDFTDDMDALLEQASYERDYPTLAVHYEQGVAYRITSLSCPLCPEDVDLSQPGWAIERRFGDSAYGYEASHNACQEAAS